MAEGNSSIKAALATEMQQLTSDIVNAAIEQSEAKDFILLRTICFWPTKWILRPMKIIFTILLQMQ